MPWKVITDEVRKKKHEAVKRYKLRHPDRVKAYLEKSAKQRSEWSKEYYKKNKEHIIQRTSEYNKNNPDVRQKATHKNKVSGGGVKKGKKDRELLKDAYIHALFRDQGFSDEFLEKHPEFIEARKLIISLKRQIYNGNQKHARPDC